MALPNLQILSLNFHFLDLHSFLIWGLLKAFILHFGFMLFKYALINKMSLKVDGESFEEAISSSQKNEYTAVLFYASWCPFSNIFQSKFSTLSSIYPQIKHLMVEQSSAMPRWVFLVKVPHLFGRLRSKCSYILGN